LGFMSFCTGGPWVREPTNRSFFAVSLEPTKRTYSWVRGRTPMLNLFALSNIHELPTNENEISSVYGDETMDVLKSF
jgi:hypothetical protein